MKTIESLIARARHWQLFVFMLLPIAVAYYLYFPLLPADPGASPERTFAAVQANFTKMMLLSVPGYLLFYAWVWVVGRVCNGSLPPGSRRHGRVFNFAVPFALCYLPIATFAFPEVIATDGWHWSGAILFPLHVVVSFLIIYAMIFAARSVASLGRDRRAGSGRSFLFFLGILYFPIGLWVIQPRVNAAFAESRP